MCSELTYRLSSEPKYAGDNIEEHSRSGEGYVEKGADTEEVQARFSQKS